MAPEDDPFQIATELSPVDQVPLRVKLRPGSNRQSNRVDAATNGTTKPQDGEPVMSSQDGSGDSGRGPQSDAQPSSRETDKADQPARTDVLDALRSIMDEPVIPAKADAPQTDPDRATSDGVAQRLAKTVEEAGYSGRTVTPRQGLGAFVAEPESTPSSENSSLSVTDEGKSDQPTVQMAGQETASETQSSKQANDDPVLQTLAEIKDLAKPLLRAAEEKITTVPDGTEAQGLQANDMDGEEPADDLPSETQEDPFGDDIGDLFAEDDDDAFLGEVEEASADATPDTKSALDAPSVAEEITPPLAAAPVKEIPEELAHQEAETEPALVSALLAGSEDEAHLEEDDVEDEEIWDAATYRPDLTPSAIQDYPQTVAQPLNDAATNEDLVEEPRADAASPDEIENASATPAISEIPPPPPVAAQDVTIASIAPPGDLFVEVEDTVSDADLCSVSKVTASTGVAPHVLRFWETRFPQLSPVYKGGLRHYRPEAVDLVKVIQRLLQVHNVPVRTVQRILQEHDSKILIEANRLNMLDSVIPEQKADSDQDTGAKIEDAFDSLDDVLDGDYKDDGDQESATDLYETMPASMVAVEGDDQAPESRWSDEQRDRLSAVLANLTNLKAEIAERRYMGARASYKPGAIPELQDPLPDADAHRGGFEAY
jgi:DNA-binding transcriptional MerR regulator